MAAWCTSQTGAITAFEGGTVRGRAWLRQSLGTASSVAIWIYIDEFCINDDGFLISKMMNKHDDLNTNVHP